MLLIGGTTNMLCQLSIENQTIGTKNGKEAFRG